MHSFITAENNFIKKNTDTKSILYVEDDRSSQLLMQHLLRNKYNVDYASTGQEGLQKAIQKKYDLILMDIKLEQGKTGVDLTHDLRSMPQYQKTPIIAITAYAMPGDDEYFKSEGCTDYIPKPLEFNTLFTKLKKLLPESKS